MGILLIMCMGILIGNRLFPQKWKSLNEKLQVVCTLLLIFSMGVMLGCRENFLEELAQLGWQSLLFCLIPIAFSVLLVYLLTKRFLKPKKKEGEES